MKHSIFALATLAAASSAWAQPLPHAFAVPNVGGAFATFISGSSQFPGGMAGSLPAFLAGNTEEGFRLSKNGVTGFSIESTAGTPAAPIGAYQEKSFNMFYAILLPTYKKIDAVSEPLAAPGAPVTQPVAKAIVVNAARFSRILNGAGAGRLGTSLPGLETITSR